jgi:hypothetical protein
MRKISSIYIDDNVKSNWFITFRGDHINYFIYIKFTGLLKEAEEKAETLKNNLWENWHGDAFQFSLSGPTLLCDIYSENDWLSIAESRIENTDITFDNEQFYTIFK